MQSNRFYAAIDLKSYYASAECVARGLDPLRTNLVVADQARTEKTICLAVSPSLKAYGLPGRARLFEVVQKVDALNQARKQMAPGRTLEGASCDAQALAANPALAIDYIVATPRMSYYVERSTQIYQIYLKYIAPEDIYVYSIDEVFIDLTPYLRTYQTTPQALVKRLIQEVWQTTGITATAGIGTNLYLSKIAMDILAKHAEPDESGIRMAELDEARYRETLWAHRPLTDFWRIGSRTAKKLERHGMYTMGDIAECSVGKSGAYHSEHLLYKLFGVNAELLIDHAWGWEPCTISDIKAYQPKSSSLSSGQVLQRPYAFEEAKLIVREMTEALVLDLVEKRLLTDQIVLTIGYDVENLSDPQRSASYAGPVVQDFYGRLIPKHAHGTANLGGWTASTKRILAEVLALFDRIVDPDLLVRRITIAAGHIAQDRGEANADSLQLDLFTDYEALQKEAASLAREKRRQQVELLIKKKYGKNAILRGANLKEASTAIARNNQIGGHRA